MAVAALALAGAIGGLPVAAGAGSDGSRASSSDALLRVRCLEAGSAGASVAAPLTLHVTRRTTWGLFLAASAAGFRPDEPVLTLLYDTRWQTPACLENANATPAGQALSEAAFWYRASSARSLGFCLVGLRSGRVACGSLRPAPAQPKL